MATQWYYQAGGEEHGPIGFRDLVELVQSGGITESDLVRSSWNTEWQPANSVVGLFYMAGRSPDDLARLSAAHDSEPAVEMIGGQDDKEAVPDIGETAEDRAAWMERLDEISILRDPKPVDTAVRESPVTEPSIAGDSDPAQGRPSDERSTTVVVSPRASKMAISTAAPSPRAASAWSSGVDSALVSVDARQAEQCEVTTPGAASRVVTRIAEMIPSREVLDARLRIGFRAVCAIVCAGIVAYAVESWSRREAIRFPEHKPSPGEKVRRRYFFPVVGRCKRRDYIGLISGLTLATATATWFAAGWLETHAD
jgi:hypothetical protein